MSICLVKGVDLVERSVRDLFGFSLACVQRSKEIYVLATTAMIGGISHYNLIIELSTVLKDPKAVQKCSLLAKIIG
jgi:hypothetical protein